jgi:hypothetical protein
MKVIPELALSKRCPTCGARVGEKCELGTGQPRTYPHKDRPKLRRAAGQQDVGASFWDAVSGPARSIMAVDV